MLFRSANTSYTIFPSNLHVNEAISALAVRGLTSIGYSLLAITCCHYGFETLVTFKPMAGATGRGSTGLRPKAHASASNLTSDSETESTKIHDVRGLR